jgi:uncharacterized protein (DUF58 family)
MPSASSFKSQSLRLTENESNRGGDIEVKKLGEGLSFERLRAYTPGDDLRKLDWNAYARTLTPYVREYATERDPHCWVVLDWSAAMLWSGGNRPRKADFALEWAWQHAKSYRQVGIVCLWANGPFIQRPALPEVAFIAAERALATCRPLPYNPADGLTQALRLIEPRATLVVLSDTLKAPKGLTVRVLDPAELGQDWPPEGWDWHWVDATGKSWRGAVPPLTLEPDCLMAVVK